MDQHGKCPESSDLDGVWPLSNLSVSLSLPIKGDIVLVGLREFQADKCDIIHKYTTDEARSLQAYGELPATARINQTAIDMAMDGGEGEEEDVGFDFDDVSARFTALYPSPFLFYFTLLCIPVCIQI